MVPSGRKQRRHARRMSAEERGARACDSKKEDKKDLGGAAEESADEKTPATDMHEKKRSAAGIVEHMGGDVQNMLERFGANINNALFAKRRRLVIHAKSSFKTSNQKIEHVLKTQQEQRKKLNQEYSERFMTLFQQWETEMEKTEEQGKKLASLYEQQQKIFQQSRIVQSQRLKTIRQLCEQYIKSIEDLEEKNGNLITGAQNELRNEMAMLQKKIMMETQEEEMATVRKSLQSMVFW